MTGFASWRWERWLGSDLPPRDDEALRETTVAVLDTGVAIAHPALRDAHLVAAKSFVGEDPCQDPLGHGSACAGVLVASAGRGGPEGIVRGARLLFGQTIGASGEGSPEALCAGLWWALEEGASVIALPLGMLRPEPTLDAAVRALNARGVTLVAAAGNPYAGQVGPMYPAACEGVLCVGARAYTELYAAWVRRPDVVVPAHDVPVVDVAASWKLMGGTSAATMIAAGIIIRTMSVRAR